MKPPTADFLLPMLPQALPGWYDLKRIRRRKGKAF